VNSPKGEAIKKDKFRDSATVPINGC